MTVHYRVRKGFRIAAGVPALILTPLGLLFLSLGLVNAFEGEPFAVLAIVLGVAGLGLGLLFGRAAWTGRAPSGVEEYGLHDEAEVQERRDEARAQGLLDE
jgi:hypothetical protein